MCEINTSLGRFFELLKNHEPSSNSLNVSESKNCSILIISKIAKHWQFSSNNQRLSGRFFDFGNFDDHTSIPKTWFFENFGN